MDDAVGRFRAGGEARAIGELTAMRSRTRAFERGGGGIASREAEDLVAFLLELSDDGGADEPRGSGDEYLMLGSLRGVGDR